MADETGRRTLRKAGHGAWRATILSATVVIVLVLFVGMAYLVYLGRMSDGPLVLFAGVVLGYLLRSVMKYL